MIPRHRLVLIVCSAALGLTALVLLGVWLEADGSTFIPDLIIGVVGAAVIGLVLLMVQFSTEQRRSHAADVTSAYNRLLDALTPLRTLELATGDPLHVSVMRTRLMQLIDAVGEDEGSSAFGEWLNAEGQLCLHRVTMSFDALRTIEDRSDAHAILSAGAPFHQWVTEFSHNIRFWHAGNMDEATMREHAEVIETLLRGEGVWVEDTMPSRNA